MNDLDVIAPNYRRAQRRWATAPLLRAHYEALATCWTDTGHGLVEYVKSFVECVCRTILAERGSSDVGHATSTTLLILALESLGLHNSKGAHAIDKILSAFNKLSDALAEVRNQQGPIAHGKNGFVEPLSADHKRIVVHVGDAILGLVLARYEGTEPDLLSTHEPYESLRHLHVRIDDAVDVEVDVDDDEEPVMLVVSLRIAEEAITVHVEPSRLLYETDRKAYVEVLRSVGDHSEPDE